MCSMSASSAPGKRKANCVPIISHYQAKTKMKPSGNARKNSQDSVTVATSKSKAQLVANQDLGANDVLFGRGPAIINYEGNVRFRALVSSRKHEYNAAICNTFKDEVARHIRREIENRNGRFLQRIYSKEEARQKGVPHGVNAWKSAAEGDILEKIKQALRNKIFQPDALQFGLASQAGGASSRASGSEFQQLFPVVKLPSHNNEVAFLASFDTDSQLALFKEQERSRHYRLEQLLETQQHQLDLPTAERLLRENEQKQLELLNLQRLQQQQRLAQQQQQLARIGHAAGYGSSLWPQQETLGNPRQDFSLAAAGLRASASNVASSAASMPLGHGRAPLLANTSQGSNAPATLREHQIQDLLHQSSIAHPLSPRCDVKDQTIGDMLATLSETIHNQSSLASATSVGSSGQGKRTIVASVDECTSSDSSERVDKKPKAYKKRMVGKRYK